MSAQKTTTSPLQYVRRVKDRVFPYLQRLALDTGIKAGNDDYSRFIILGRSRVGSNFLRGLLNSHPGISVFGELFQNPEVFEWTLPGHRETRGIREMRRDQPVEFLQSQVFHRFPAEVHAVGFKIFYYHAQTRAWKPVWDYLQGQNDLRVLHIKRRNILKTHLSRKRAALSDVWVDTRDGKKTRPVGPIHLDYQECLDDFNQTRGWETDFDAFFSGHPVYEVIYEDLASDYTRLMPEIQAFLGVDVRPVEPQTYKQSHRPLSEAIENFNELKARFRGTPWQGFFEEA